MEEKKKKNKKAYLNDFKKNEKGDYEYHGIQFEWEGSKEEFSKEMIILWAAGLVMAVSLITAGCLPVPGMMDCVYVILPYTVSVICGCSVLWGLCRLTKWGRSLRSYVYDATVGQLPMRAIGTILGAAVSLIGECIYLIRNGAGGQTGGAVLFILVSVFVLISMVFLVKRIKKMEWNQKNK